MKIITPHKKNNFNLDAPSFTKYLLVLFLGVFAFSTVDAQTMIYEQDFEKEARFEKKGNRYYWDGLINSENYPTTEQAPNRNGKAGRFYLNKTGAGTTLGKTYRTEVVMGEKGVFDFGKEYWLSMDYMFTKWEHNEKGEYSLAPFQVHTTPARWGEGCGDFQFGALYFPFMMGVQNGKMAFTTYKKSMATPDWSAPLELHKWTTVVVHFKISYNDDGFVEAWKDGVKIVDVEGRNTYETYSDSDLPPAAYEKECANENARRPYIKMGVYKGNWRHKNLKYPSKGVERELYIDNYKLVTNTSTNPFISETLNIDSTQSLNVDGEEIPDLDDTLSIESVSTDSDGIGNNSGAGDDGDSSSDAVEIAVASNPSISNGGLTNSPSLVAHYTFDNITGVKVPDKSGNGNSAIRSGTKVVPGKIGNGLQFDGKSDYVVSGAFDVVGSEITLSAWIKVNDFGIHDARIISKATGSAEQDHYWMLSTIESNGSKLRFRLKANGQTATLIGTRNVPVGKWVHVMASYDGLSMRLYLDGKESGSMSKTGDISANPAAAIRVGDNPKTSARNFDGVIDDVRIYNQALSAEEISDTTGGTTPVPQPQSELKCSTPWRSASLTHYSSYPAGPSSEESTLYNGWTWKGQFYGLKGVQSESWVKSNNIVAVHLKDWDALGSKKLRIRQGNKEIIATAYDACSDADCDNCCTRNLGDNNFLIDLEKYTKQRFGSGSGTVQFQVCD